MLIYEDTMTNWCVEESTAAAIYVWEEKPVFYVSKHILKLTVNLDGIMIEKKGIKSS